MVYCYESLRAIISTVMDMPTLQGGAFGGKEFRTFLVAVPTALAAQRLYLLFFLVSVKSTAHIVCGAGSI